jgi:hypothetical protein
MLRAMSENEASLLCDCQSVAAELGQLLVPPATIQVSVEQERPKLLRSKSEPLLFHATARVTSARQSHQRAIQGESVGATAAEALSYLRAALELKARVMRSGRSGTRSPSPR